MKTKKHVLPSFGAQCGEVTTLIHILSFIERPQDILALMTTDRTFYRFINYLWKQLTRVHYVNHYNESARYRWYREPAWIAIFSQAIRHMRKTDPTHNPFLSAAEFDKKNHRNLPNDEIINVRDNIAANTYQPLKDYAFRLVLSTPRYDRDRIWLAVYFNQVDYLQEQIAKKTIDAKVVNRPNVLTNNSFFVSDSLLGIAVKYRHLQIARLLLMAGADPNVGNFTLTHYKDINKAPLFIATQNNDAAMIALLIEFKAEFINYYPQDGLLLVAAKNRYNKAARALIAADVAINECNILGETPLFITEHTGNIKLRTKLLQYVARIGDIHYSLFVAISQPNVDMLRLTVSNKNIDLNTKDSDTGLSLLCYAIQYGKDEHVDVLIEAKVDVNFRDNQELSPVMFAMKHHKLKALKRLIVAGADCSELFKLYSYRRYKDFGTKEQHKDLVRAMNEAKLELYIQKTQKRPENHYKHSLTISFFCFTKTFHFGGYSSTEKLKAAEKLEKVLAGKSKETSLNKKKYKGALNNGELKTIYRALMKR